MKLRILKNEHLIFCQNWQLDQILSFLHRKNTMASLSFPTVCLLVLAGCAAYVTANGYGQSAYSYARPQIYAPARPSFGYAGTGVGGGLSGGLGLNSDLGGILPILLICKLAA